MSTARLFGAVVAAARLEDGLLWSEVTPAMLAAAGARPSETESIIMYLAGVEEAVVFALLYERDDGWRASLRSNSDAVDVAALAGRYGGGGHRRAAGCTIVGEPGAGRLPGRRTRRDRRQPLSRRWMASSGATRRGTGELDVGDDCGRWSGSAVRRGNRRLTTDH